MSEFEEAQETTFGCGQRESSFKHQSLVFVQHSTMATLHPPAVGSSMGARSPAPAPCSRPVLLRTCRPIHSPFMAEHAGNAAPCRQQRLCCAQATPSEAPSTQQQQMDRKAGRAVYRPRSFAEMVDDAVACVTDGIKDGLTRLEVEFPPVPTKLDGYKGASDVFIDSNVQLALAGARKPFSTDYALQKCTNLDCQQQTIDGKRLLFNTLDVGCGMAMLLLQLAATGRKVHVLMPDQGEYDRAYKLFKATLGMMEGTVTLGHLKEGKNSFSLDSLFSPFERGPDSVAAGQAADTYVIINATCVELLNVRDYVQRLAPEGSKKVVVLWNLELDSLRGDLGLPGFPPKEMHYDFLAAFRPAFYLRTRDYSKSVAVAPFLVNYSGALFREYPGPWQVMLKQDSGEYACIAEDLTRYNLGELKEELQAAMGLAEEEGSSMQVLRRGLKNSTWWEDDYEVEKSHDWRL